MSCINQHATSSAVLNIDARRIGFVAKSLGQFPRHIICNNHRGHGRGLPQRHVDAPNLARLGPTHLQPAPRASGFFTFETLRSFSSLLSTADIALGTRARLEPSSAAAQDLSSNSGAEYLKTIVVVAERRWTPTSPMQVRRPIPRPGCRKRGSCATVVGRFASFSGYLASPRAGTGLPLRQDSQR